MINVEQFNTDRFVIGFCRAEDLEKIKIKKSILRFEYGKKPGYYMKKGRTVIVVGNTVDFSKDVYRRGITKCVTGDDYPAYKEANKKVKEIACHLKSNGYKAVISTGISYKNAAVLAGLGVWGKNSLVINKEFGTSLRFAALVTDWVPEAYGEKIKEDYCKNCNICLEQCPYNCLRGYKVNAKKCFCKYIKKGQFSLEIPMCDICQRDCPYNGMVTKSNGIKRKDLCAKIEKIDCLKNTSVDQENVFLKTILDEIVGEINSKSRYAEQIEPLNKDYLHTECLHPTKRQISSYNNFLSAIEDKNTKMAYHYFSEFVDNYHQGDYANISDYELQVIGLFCLILCKFD